MSLYAEGLTVLFFLDLAVPFFWAFRMFLTRDMLSPILARPVPGGKFVRGCVAVMARPKGLAPFRVRFLDPHVGVTEADDLLFAVLASLNHELLGAIWRPSWFVALHLRLIDSHV
tara:strand:+ start:1125 stop:1469 length:345 start_codon:yes stop_codon:yes gene_type:complete